nr:hypothetical protein [Tanacetum cinerariifolium]
MSKASDDIQERELHQLQLMQENAKESCMTSFRLLHSFLQVLSYDESKSIRVSEHEFMTLFGQDNETFTKRFFAECTRIKDTQFRETLLQHMGNVKKYVAKRAHHQRQYERRVNNRQMQTQESKINSGSALDVVSSQALDADLVVMKSNGTESRMHDTSSITPYYVPKVRESVFVKPHHVIASGSSRDSSNESYRSNDMAHKYYLEEYEFFFGLQTLIFSTCQKCVFNANHDDCITMFLIRVNSRAKVQSPKTRNINKPVEPKSHTQKPDRQIAIGQRFSPNKSFAVREKPNTPRSCHRWIPTGRIFKTTGLRWIPTRNMFIDSTTKVDSEPPNGSNGDITNPYECKQSLDVSTVSLTPYVPPSKKDYEILFQQLFDEHFNPPPRVVSSVSAVVAAPRVVDPVGLLSSTTIDQDVPSASSSPTTQEIQSQVTHQGAEEQIHRHQNA